MKESRILDIFFIFFSSGSFYEISEKIHIQLKNIKNEEFRRRRESRECERK
jgi:hypothetical protein